MPVSTYGRNFRTVRIRPDHSLRRSAGSTSSKRTLSAQVVFSFQYLEVVRQSLLALLSVYFCPAAIQQLYCLLDGHAPDFHHLFIAASIDAAPVAILQIHTQRLRIELAKVIYINLRLLLRWHFDFFLTRPRKMSHTIDM